MARPPPLKSFPVLGKDADTGSVDVGVDILSGAQSYSFEKRKLKLYPDDSGRKTIPPEWRKNGVTITGYRTGGANEDSYIRYEFEIKGYRNLDVR